MGMGDHTGVDVDGWMKADDFCLGQSAFLEVQYLSKNDYP